MTDLAISIASFRTPALLRRCLAALAAERDTLALEVTVVDNASGDGSAELVEREFPWVRLIRNARNVGFGAAHNQVLGAAEARHVLILNSDARPLPGALQTLVAYLDAHPDVGLVGPRLRYPDGRVQSSRRRFPTPATFFFESTQLQRFWPDNAIVRRYYVADRSDDHVQDVDWLVGACLCVRTSVVREVGMFDARYFMYSEELDWCRRVRAAGWRVVFVPAAEVQHQEGASARLDLISRDQRFQASKLRYAERWHGAWVARAVRGYLIVEYALRGIEETVKLTLGSRVVERRARLRLIGSGLRHALRG